MGYKDISSDHIYQKEIEFNQIYGIMSGDENGNFHPTSILTKADLCVIIANLLDFNYDSYRLDSSKIPNNIPSWVQPYFEACQSNQLLPKGFKNALNKPATNCDLLYIFDQANYLFQPIEIHFNASKYLPSRSARHSLSRKTCAHLIFHYCKSASYSILKNLEDTDLSSVATFLTIYFRHTWIDFFYDIKNFNIKLYQIFYILKQSVRKSHEKLYSEQLDIMIKINEKKNEYFLYKKEETVYHYTSLKVLEILTKPRANFRLSNTVYLNDPQEGRLAKNILSTFTEIEKYNNLKVFLSAFISQGSYVSSYFIGSFMKTKDYLPMWVQYGEKGAGCYIGIDLKKSCEEMYEVTYSKEHISDFFTDILDILNSYIKSHPHICFQLDPVFYYATKILEQGCYLFKDPAYKHENEVRILHFVSLKTAKAETNARPGEIFPRIYWETPLTDIRFDNIGIPFSSITLGPTVSNPEQIATALAQRGYNTDIIRKSEIKFR